MATKKKATKKKATKKKATKKKTTKKKATKKKATKKTAALLPPRVQLEIVDLGPTADRAGRLYEGFIVRASNRLSIGIVVAGAKTAARRKLSRVARSQL